MPLEVIQGPDALENYRRNAWSKFPGRGDPDNRIEPLCAPGFRPSFRFGPDARIFTMGSCFARNVESALVDQGFDVIVRRPEFAQLVASIGQDSLNNYGVPSIFNELDWALNGGFEFESNLVEERPGLFTDIHLSRSLRPAPYQEVAARRNSLCEFNRQVLTADVVIMTLGLTELWFDKASSRYLNQTPRKSILALDEGRFELHVLDYHTTISYMRRVMDLLKTQCVDGIHVVLTVSPVPLGATFTSDDVIVANSYSKSLLRVVAQDVASEYDFVDYYPSYESVVHSCRESAWTDDLRHVQHPLIELNVARMVSAYTGGDSDRSTDVFLATGYARSVVDRDPEAALAALAPLKTSSNAEVWLLMAEAYAGLGQSQNALNALQNVSSDKGGSLGRRTAIRVHAKLSLHEDALNLAKSWLVEEPDQTAAWSSLASLLLAMDRHAEAIEVLRGWAGVERESAEPWALMAYIFERAGDLRAAAKAYGAGIGKKRGSEKLRLAYAKFLVGRGELNEADRILDGANPQEKEHEAAISEMRSFVETVRSAQS